MRENRSIRALTARLPSLATLFGVAKLGPLARVLLGEVTRQAHLLRSAPNDLNIGETPALGVNDRANSDAVALLQSPARAEALAGMHARLMPDVVLYDMPPALYHDDVVAGGCPPRRGFAICATGSAPTRRCLGS